MLVNDVRRQLEMTVRPNCSPSRTRSCRRFCATHKTNWIWSGRRTTISTRFAFLHIIFSRITYLISYRSWCRWTSASLASLLVNRTLELLTNSERCNSTSVNFFTPNPLLLWIAFLHSCPLVVFDSLSGGFSLRNPYYSGVVLPSRMQQISWLWSDCDPPRPNHDGPLLVRCTLISTVPLARPLWNFPVLDSVTTEQII